MARTTKRLLADTETQAEGFSPKMSAGEAGLMHVASFPTPGRALLRRLWLFASSQRLSPKSEQATILPALTGALTSAKGEASGFISVMVSRLERTNWRADTSPMVSDRAGPRW